MIQGPQFTELFSSPQLYHEITEGLFTHFFPDSVSAYNKGNIEFFLEFINEQVTSKDINSDSQPQSLINLSKFKFHLDRILCKGWSTSGGYAEPLKFYKLEVATHNFI